MGRLYMAHTAFFTPLMHEMLPLNTHKTAVKPGQTSSIRARVQTLNGFWPTALAVSDAGTPGGAADWIVNDLKIGNRSQFVHSGDLPGDLFSTNAADPFVCFEVARGGADVELLVTYVGKNKEGCPFFGALTGTEYDPGIFEIVREAFAQAFASASRGLSRRPSR
jgi:hypothetical protein